MKRIFWVCSVFVFFVSCATVQYDPAIRRPIGPSDTPGGFIQTTFNSQWYILAEGTRLYKDQAKIFTNTAKSIYQQAFAKLLEEAEKTYQGQFDIKNIEVAMVQYDKGTKQYEYSATAQVVTTGAAGKNSGLVTATGIEGAINRASQSLINDLPVNSIIAVLSISSKDRDTATSVIEELEFQFVDSKKFKIVDRKTLDTIRTEQNFQLSGDVDDNSAVSIGKMLGANFVITGSVTGTGTTQRLTIKVLDVKTAQIITMAREQF